MVKEINSKEIVCRCGGNAFLVLFAEGHFHFQCIVPECGQQMCGEHLADDMKNIEQGEEDVEQSIN